MYDAAIEEVQIAVRLSGESTMSLAILGHAHAAAGHPRQAKEILAKLARRSRDQDAPSYRIALVRTGLGDRDKAISWLERADPERSAWLAWIGVEPRIDGLRSDARFVRLLRRLMLP
ncbi:MAG TPA: hypothetical protein VJQ43_05545 [Thermoplasmata archaeon]|nr:hypothetical protein [Thermoplasmata archaeon]